jgi:hypothetical protein
MNTTDTCLHVRLLSKIPRLTAPNAKIIFASVYIRMLHQLQRLYLEEWSCRMVRNGETPPWHSSGGVEENQEETLAIIPGMQTDIQVIRFGQPVRFTTRDLGGSGSGDMYFFGSKSQIKCFRTHVDTDIFSCFLCVELVPKVCRHLSGTPCIMLVSWYVLFTFNHSEYLTNPYLARFELSLSTRRKLRAHEPPRRWNLSNFKAFPTKFKRYWYFLSKCSGTKI